MGRQRFSRTLIQAQPFEGFKLATNKPKRVMGRADKVWVESDDFLLAGLQFSAGVLLRALSQTPHIRF